MKTAQGGYKAMIRDRVPRTVDAALKWCKAKNAWVEYVYDTYVSFLMYDKKAKDQQVRTLLGISSLNRTFEFDKTIEWDDLDKVQKEYWQNVSKWVHFFEKEMLNIVDMYETLKIQRGNDEQYIKDYICTAKFGALPQHWQDKLYKYMIEHIKKYYV